MRELLLNRLRPAVASYRYHSRRSQPHPADRRTTSMDRKVSQQKRRPDPDLLAQGAVLVAALAQVGTAALGSRSRGGRPTVEELSNSLDLPLVPANGTFAIWGPLYAGSLALAGYQAFPTRRADPLLRRVRLPMAIACAGNAAWVPLFTSRRYTAALGAILTTLAGSTIAYARASSAGTLTPVQALLVRAPAGALSGWISVAAPSAVTMALISGHQDRQSSGVPRWPVPVVVVVTGLAAAITRALPSSASYPAAVSWGLAGLAANRHARPSVRVTAAGGAAALVTIALASRAGASA